MREKYLPFSSKYNLVLEINILCSNLSKKEAAQTQRNSDFALLVCECDFGRQFTLYSACGPMERPFYRELLVSKAIFAPILWNEMLHFWVFGMFLCRNSLNWSKLFHASLNFRKIDQFTQIGCLMPELDSYRYKWSIGHNGPS